METDNHNGHHHNHTKENQVGGIHEGDFRRTDRGPADDVQGTQPTSTGGYRKPVLYLSPRKDRWLHVHQLDWI